jgi:hypothetical protein
MAPSDLAKLTVPPAARISFTARNAALLLCEKANTGPAPSTFPWIGSTRSILCSVRRVASLTGCETATISTPIWMGSVQPVTS